MTDISRGETNKSDFRSSIPESSDEQIIAILKKRSQYQKEAADLAIQEAIKRQLIHSEQDLFSEEFQDEKVVFSWFPKIVREQVKNRTRKSLARVLLFIGAVPAFLGSLGIFNGEFVKGMILFILGVVWIISAFKIMKKVQVQLVNLLFILLVISLIYVLKVLLEMKGLIVMDYAIPVVFYLLVLYGLLFLRRLK